MGNRPANHKFEMKKWENIKKTKTDRTNYKINKKALENHEEKQTNEKNGTNPPSAINVNAIQSAREPGASGHW